MIDVTAGGSNAASSCGIGNVGYFPSEPQLVFEWFGNEGPLFIDTAGLNGTDTVIYVQAPNGVTHFNDDYMHGNLNAAIELTGPRAPAGLYRVWVGSYSPTQGSAQLMVRPRITR